ncbi:MAG: STAS domain-containing protein [Spartobacteria bacterium]|nr:STAS domain-containing protein [Spartobacteria bacterium]
MSRIAIQRKYEPDLIYVDAFCRELQALLRDRGLDDVLFDVELLAREAMTNAVVHGAGEADGTFLCVSLYIGSRWLLLRVGDGGSGFDWHRAMKVGLDPEATCGRGIPIYNMYADRVSFNTVGSSVSLWKKIRGGKNTMSQYTVKTIDGVCHITLSGDLTASLVPEIKELLEKEFDTGLQSMEFDLDATDVLDSSGIGLLVACHNSLTKQGGQIRIINVNSNILRLMQGMRLEKRLNVSGK